MDSDLDSDLKAMDSDLDLDSAVAGLVTSLIYIIDKYVVTSPDLGQLQFSTDCQLKVPIFTF